MRRSLSRGFTLLEVMVAIAILGLSLTVILSAQAGLFSGVQRTQHLTMVAGLARCRMTEIEYELLHQGFQLLDVSDEGACCEEEESSTYTCAWKIERVELPEMTDLQTLAGEGTDGGGTGDALSTLMDLKAKGTEGLSASGSGAPGDLSALTQSFGGEAMGGMQGIATTLMGLVYPNLKPMLEASIRRVTVTVRWREGKRERDLVVTQFITRPQEGLDPLADVMPAPGDPEDEGR